MHSSWRARAERYSHPRRIPLVKTMKALSRLITKYKITVQKDLQRLDKRFVHFLNDVCQLLAKHEGKQIPSSPNELNIHFRLNEHTV
jgi:hypothetical protein